jgi:hypothetical protein
MRAQFNEIRSIKPMSAEAESYPWLEVAMKEETIIFLTAFNALLTWLRVLSHLEAISPKTRQLTQVCCAHILVKRRSNPSVGVVCRDHSTGPHLDYLDVCTAW